MRRCTHCGSRYDDGSMKFCISCGAMLQNEEPLPSGGRCTKCIMVKTVAIAIVGVILAGLCVHILFDDSHKDIPGYIRTNKWVYEVDGNTYSLDFEIGGPELVTAEKSIINRTGSSSEVSYTVDSGGISRKVWAVGDYIVVGETIRNLESKLKSIFPAAHGTPDATNVNYATFLMNFCQSRPDTRGETSFRYMTDDYVYGTDEYWNYPIETLYRMGGDCEDTSILMAALLEAAGFNSGIALLPGHAMAIIDKATTPAGTPAASLVLAYGTDYAKTVAYASKEYWMLESTNSDFSPGVISGKYAHSTFHLYLPVPGADYAV